MADRTRSSNRRTTHQHSSIVAQQNAPRRSTRSTSRSHDTSGAERAKLSVKERKTAGPTVVDDVEGTMSGGIQSGGKKNRNTRSKPAEGISIISVLASHKAFYIYQWRALTLHVLLSFVQLQYHAFELRAMSN